LRGRGRGRPGAPRQRPRNGQRHQAVSPADRVAGALGPVAVPQRVAIAVRHGIAVAQPVAVADRLTIPVADRLTVTLADRLAVADTE
jgi:hypothetical protein